VSFFEEIILPALRLVLQHTQLMQALGIDERSLRNHGEIDPRFLGALLLKNKSDVADFSVVISVFMKKNGHSAVRSAPITPGYCETAYSQILYARTAIKESRRDYCRTRRAKRL
jgi:hypothetical protein